MKDSSVMQSWNLHGGNDCWNWCKRKIKMTKQSNLNTKKNMRISGAGGLNNGMGIFVGTDMISTTNHRVLR